MGYNLLINGVYWGYNPFANHLLTSWDIQVGAVSKWDALGFRNASIRMTSLRFRRRENGGLGLTVGFLLQGWAPTGFFNEVMTPGNGLINGFPVIFQSQPYFFGVVSPLSGW